MNLKIECDALETVIATKKKEIEGLSKMLNFKNNQIINVNIELELKQVFKKSLKSKNNLIRKIDISFVYFKRRS
jgi:hypothetical protein